MKRYLTVKKKTAKDSSPPSKKHRVAPPDPPPVPKHLERSIEFHQLHHVYLPAAGRFASSPNAAWDGTQMTLKEAVQFHIVQFFNHITLNFDSHLPVEDLPSEVCFHMKNLYLDEKDAKYPHLHSRRYRNRLPHVEELESYVKYAHPANPQAASTGPRHACNRLLVGDLHVFSADQPPLTPSNRATYNNLVPYRRGWIRRRWLCDCPVGTSDSRCPHVGWWPGNGPRVEEYVEAMDELPQQLLVKTQFPRVIRPIPFDLGVARSTFGAVRDHEKFPLFRDLFFRLSDRGLHMERNDLVRGGKDKHGVKYDESIQIVPEEGRRYEQAGNVRSTFEKGETPARTENISKPSEVIMGIFLADVVRRIPLAASGDRISVQLRQRTAMLDDLHRATKELRALLDGEDQGGYHHICFPGDPAVTVPFETLARDFSMPHAFANDHALYTRYLLQAYWHPEGQNLRVKSSVILIDFGQMVQRVKRCSRQNELHYLPFMYKHYN